MTTQKTSTMRVGTDFASDFEFPNMQSQWQGYISSIDKTNIAMNVMVEDSLNMYKALSGRIVNRPGQKLLGVANATIAPCTSSFVWNTSWGETRTMVVSDGNVWAVINDTWYALFPKNTFLATRVVFDSWYNNAGAPSAYSTGESKDRVLFVCGDSNIYHWSGGYSTILSTTATTITKPGTTFWEQEGFSGTTGEMSITINGNVYTYTGGQDTTTLTGVSPSPVGEAIGSNVLQTVMTAANMPGIQQSNPTFVNDFIKVINAQVYVGSYNSRVCYISSNVDFTNYTEPTPTLAGNPVFLTLDGTLKGFGVQQGNAAIGIGKDKWAIITFPQATEGGASAGEVSVKVDVKPVAILQAPLAHEFIGNFGGNIVYLAQDNQLRVLGDFNTLFVTGYSSFSQSIATELANQDFTGGSLSCVGEFTYINAPKSGTTYLYQVRTDVDPTGKIVAERLWHAPFIWNVTNIAEQDGLVVGFSNANPQIYQLWDTDQWHDDSPSGQPLPYQCTLVLSYWTLNRRQGLQVFDKLFTEGYITATTPLQCQINYNYEGFTNSIPVPINMPGRSAYLFTPNNVSAHGLGDEVLGDDILGDEFTTLTNSELALPKFKNINSLGEINCFEYQMVYSTNSVDARWEILAVATNAEIAMKQQATFLINKLRT